MMIDVTAISSCQPRATGRRIGFIDLPAAVRAWTTQRFGNVEVLREHIGGMSPGCATSLVTSSARRLFIKAVGVDLNDQTVALFRQEIQLLRRLREAPYRPALLASFDNDGWIALVLEHVPGRYPDLGTSRDFEAVARVVEEQLVELSPPPVGVEVLPLAVTAQRWSSRWADMQDGPQRFLPAWAAAGFDDLMRRVVELSGVLTATTLCHFDVRDDNLLVRDDGRAVIVDWGMARRGPAWTDLALLAAQKPTATEAQQWLERWIPVDAQETVTSLLLSFGGSQAWNARQPAKPSLPSFAGFCRDDARRLLAIARLRLSA